MGQSGQNYGANAPKTMGQICKGQVIHNRRKINVEKRTQGKKDGEENGITKAGKATKYQIVFNHFRIALLPGQLTCLALNIFIILKIGY